MRFSERSSMEWLSYRNFFCVPMIDVSFLPLIFDIFEEKWVIDFDFCSSFSTFLHVFHCFVQCVFFVYKFFLRFHCQITYMLCLPFSVRIFFFEFFFTIFFYFIYLYFCRQIWVFVSFFVILFLFTWRRFSWYHLFFDGCVGRRWW